MADALLQSVGLPYPTVAAVAFGSFSLDQATDAIEIAFQIDEAVTITELWVRLNTITGTSPTYIVELYAVDGSGLPTGSVLATTAAFTPSGPSTWQKRALTASYAATRGQFLCMVLKYSSGTVDGSNFASFTSNFSAGVGLNMKFPYMIQNNANTRTRQTGWPCFAFASAAKAFGKPILAASNVTINNSTFGAKFTLPDGWGSTYQVKGLRCFTTTWSANRTLTMTLWNGGAASDTTVLQNVTIDTDVTSANNQNIVEYFFDEATLSTLNFGDTYRIGFATSDAFSQAFLAFTVAAAADLEAFPLGQQFTLSTRTTGNWTDTATTRIICELILGDITEPAVGGGGGAIIVSSF